MKSGGVLHAACRVLRPHHRRATDRPRSFTPEFLLILGNVLVAKLLATCLLVEMLDARASRVVLMLELQRPFQQGACMFERHIARGLSGGDPWLSCRRCRDFLSESSSFEPAQAVTVLQLNQGGATDPPFFISLIVRWRPSRNAGARGPARPIPARTPRVVWLGYRSCDSPRKRGLVAFPLLPLPAPAFCR